MMLSGIVLAEISLSAVPYGPPPAVQPSCEFAAKRAHGCGSNSDAAMGLASLVDLSAFPGIRIVLIDYLPPGKTGMTTGEGKQVRIAISRRYPLFVQYSTLTHELVHARDRQLGMHRRLSRAEREMRALAAELSPANISAVTEIGETLDGRSRDQLSAFLRDLVWHYRAYAARTAAVRASRPGAESATAPLRRKIQRRQRLRPAGPYRAYRRPLARGTSRFEHRTLWWSPRRSG